MDPGNIRGAEPRIGSTAHGREDTTHTRHSHTDSDRRAKESRTGRTEREFHHAILQAAGGAAGQPAREHRKPAGAGRGSNEKTEAGKGGNQRAENEGGGGERHHSHSGRGELTFRRQQG